MAKSAGGGGRAAGGAAGGGGSKGPTIITAGAPSGNSTINMAALRQGAPITSDMPAEKHSVFSLDKMLRPHVDQYGRIPNAQLNNALRIVRVDGEVRRSGRLMTSKYSGTDTATNEKFNAGTQIYYGSGGRTVIADRATNKRWLKKP
jgi:hypothetical protein